MDSIQAFSILTDKISQTKLSFLVTNKYIYALVILIIFILLSRLFLFILEKYITRLTRKTKTDLDDKLIEAIHKPLYYLIVFIGIYLALLPLEFNAIIIFSKIIFSLITLTSMFLLMRISKVLIELWGIIWAKKTKTSLEYDLLPLMKKTISVILIIVAFLVILKIWGIDITGFLAGLGIAGIAIGFAVKDSLANIFGGISLILDKNIKRNDKVKLETGELGIIEDIGIRSTKLLTFDNELIIIPNGILANTRIQNYVLPEEKQRVNINFGVAYGSDIKRVKKVVLDTVKKIEHVINNPAPEVHFMEMGDSSLLMTARIWVDDYQNAYGVQLQATEKIYNALNKQNINIPFPTRTVYIKK